MRRILPCLLSVMLLAAACGDDASPTEAGAPGDGTTTTTTTTTTAAPVDLDTPEGSLAAARDRWAANGLTSYRLATSELCFCPETNWVNTVVDGDVVGHEPVGEESFYDPGPRSMETLFDEIDAAIADGYHTLDLDFDDETGAVVRYWVDVDEMIADEEHGVEVTSLTPYDPDASAVVPTAAALVDDYGCGYLFAKGNADQSLALVISWTGSAADGPDLSAPIDLAITEDWSATITAGTDLFANWCDDVFEPDEPTPAVTDTWTIVDGTVTVDTDLADVASCGGTEVTATLSGTIAKTTTEGVNALDDISPADLTLDDIALTNPAWGCFAG
ncbi:MAG: DUF6174 domain-containing protein [Acidimicrobiales bacterium]